MGEERVINEMLFRSKLEGCISSVKNISSSGTPFWHFTVLIRKPYFWNIFTWKKIYDFHTRFKFISESSMITVELV